MAALGFAQRFILAAVTVALSLGTGNSPRARDKPKRETIQAKAMGQNTAAGKNFNETITIEAYSTPKDQKELLDAFAQGGHPALVKALSKMKPQGRVGVTGTLACSIACVRNFPGEDGRTIRLMTDRPINILEVRQAGCSKDYDISALELNLKNDKKLAVGALIIGLRLSLDKDDPFVFENHGSGPMRLRNVIERN